MAEGFLAGIPRSARQRHPDRFAHRQGQGLIEGESLRQIADPSVGIADGGAEDAHGTLERHEAEDGPKHRALSRAVGSDEHGDRPLLDRK